MGDITTLGRACRHYLAREALIGDGQCCKIGHPIRKIVTATIQRVEPVPEPEPPAAIPAPDPEAR